MALLTILEYPDARLKTVAAPVTVFDERLRARVRDLTETMYAAPGVGLAATQVDWHERVVVIDTSEERDQPQVFVNPVILQASAQTRLCEEGCL